MVAPLIFLLVPLTLVIQSYGAADELQSKECSTSSSGGNVSSGGGGLLYQMNLRQFLAALPSNAINNKGFFNGSVGSVYGMAMCPADDMPDHCESCLRRGAQGLPVEQQRKCLVPGAACSATGTRPSVRADALGDNIFFDVIAFYAQDHAGNFTADTSSAFQKTRDDLFKDLSTAVVTSPLKIDCNGQQDVQRHVRTTSTVWRSATGTCRTNCAPNTFGRSRRISRLLLL